MHQLYSKCSMIISKMILSRQSKRWSHQARLPITRQPSSYKINPHTHDKINDNLIKQPTNPHIVNHPKIIRYPSPCKINPGLKLLTLYLVGSERGCAKLEKPRMERSYNGLKGWCCAKLTMDGCRSKQSQSAGSEQGTALIIRRWITISNSLGQISDPRLIGSISSMIGQASRPQYASEEMPQVKSTTHHITKHKHMSIKENASNGIIW